MNVQKFKTNTAMANTVATANNCQQQMHGKFVHEMDQVNRL